MSEDVEFRSKDFADVMLTEDDVSAIINGKKVYKVTPKGEKISISQSLLVGILAPVINYENQVMTGDIIKNMEKGIANNMQNRMRLGS